MSAHSFTISSSSDDLSRSSSPVDLPQTKTNLGWIAHINTCDARSISVDPQVHLTAGTMYWIYQQHDEAAKHFEKGMESAPSHPDYPVIGGHPIEIYHERTAECYLALNQYSKAATHLKRYLITKMSPSDQASAEKHILTAKCCLAMNDYAEAATHFKCALGFYNDQHPKMKTAVNLTQLRIDTAHACLRAKEYQTAAAIFENTIQSFKGKKTGVPPLVFQSAARACFLNHEPEKAIAYFKKYEKECRKKGFPIFEKQSEFFSRLDQN